MSVEGPDRTPGPETIARVQRRLLPLLFTMYVAALLPRGNVGLGALQLTRDLGFSATLFGLGTGVFVLGYAPFAIPSNLLIARIGARRWIAPILIASGALGSATMLVRGPVSFAVLRFLLGVAEAGFFPGIIYYLSEWLPAARRAQVTATFMTAIPVAGVVGGASAGLILKLAGQLGLAGWQWLFLLQGLPAIALGFGALAWLTDAPGHARWLAPAERVWLSDAVRDAPPPGTRRGHAFRDALAQRWVWLLGVLAFLVLTCAYAYGAWSPQILKGMTHLSDSGVSVLTALIAAAAVAGMVANGAHSDRRRERPLHVAVPVLLMALGWVVCVWSGSGAPGVVALACVAVGISSQYGPFWALSGSFLSGEARAGGIALIASLGALGGFVGPYLVGRIKDATGDYRLAYAVLALMACAAVVLALSLRRAARDSSARIG